jgi:hypothetical protein
MIKSCPFCTNSNQKQFEVHQDIYHDGPNCFVICQMCKACGPIAWSKEEAEKLWNDWGNN